jgi:acetyl-CoA carboxylase carboxyl transferase beta subunit/acetyl-CoA carboxylase carboxyl transferase alpha subunit/acetyl-CoA carboxylase biotin carboxyl carrier protein
MTPTIGKIANETAWVLCTGCKSPIYHKRLVRNIQVCPECGKHERLTAHQRLETLLDPGSLKRLHSPAETKDVLGFVDTLPYPARLAQARKKTGLDEAAVCASGTIHDHAVITAVMDFRFLGGSLGATVGDLITLAAETALAEQTPLLIVAASGGARMQEGTISLMQMAKTSAALAQLDEAGILTVSLITDPTFGGVAASFATSTDVIIAEPGARLGFAGRRVIEQTIRQELPPDFQTAEFLMERGFIDRIVPRQRLRNTLAELLRIGNFRTPVADSAQLDSLDQDQLIRDPHLLPQHDPWDRVGRARALDRPTTVEYASLVFTGFQELHGDRIAGDCVATVAGTAWLGTRPVVVIGHQKGHTPAELGRRNFGMSMPSGYRKAARIMRLAAKLGLPVITLVDTPGAHPGPRAEEQGQAIAIAECIQLMTSLPVPVIAVITGEGGSGGALALATANRVLMCANSIYSVISPEGCAAILWQDRAMAPQAARALGIDARSLLSLGVVDGVLPEPEGGTGTDPPLTADRLRAALVSTLAELAPLTARELVNDRRKRFRQFGGRLGYAAETETTQENSRDCAMTTVDAHKGIDEHLLTRTGNTVEEVVSTVRALLDALPAQPESLRLQADQVTIEIAWPREKIAPQLMAPTPAAPVLNTTNGSSGASAGERRATAHYICAPSVGTFHRSPEPGASPYITVGDVVRPGQQVGIVEVMKLMLPVEADRSGRVSRVLKENGQPVEHGEQLIELAPTEDE